MIKDEMHHFRVMGESYIVCSFSTASGVSNLGGVVVVGLLMESCRRRKLENFQAISSLTYFTSEIGAQT